MNIQEIVIVTLLVEILEVMLQYSSTLKGSIFKIFNYYQRSPFIFFASNVGYIWLLFVSVNYGVFNMAMVLAVTLKSIDIFTKMHLIQKLFLKPDSNYITEIAPMLEAKTPYWVWLIGPMTYPYVVFIALS